MLFSGDALRLCKCDGVPRIYLCNRLKCYLSGDALHGSGSRIHPIKCHRICVIHYFPDPFSPRARGVLFTLSRPKGLRVGPIVEKCAEFRNPFLKKISTKLFSEIEIKQGYPLFKISHTNLTPKLYCYQFLS